MPNLKQEPVVSLSALDKLPANLVQVQILQEQVDVLFHILLLST